ncbi:hypothetical protein K469DRAFT_712160 [Zopfia rhizophila CBS 207.26]|uniref:Uncharacterized protein n=1 Tax=Zopfia rhizophila CBS 207.26 TaxID=1314779 RepID=A0A6A6EQ44_9PEZI|nr:hypothetical protein K469DRAFT_712160 [Zopfia rhizophila CBS 207.26]
MVGLLDLPLELRNLIYDILLYEPLEPRPRGVLTIYERGVKDYLPLQCYRGLLRVNHQIYREFKEAIRHLSSSKQINYLLDFAFIHGRPFFSLTWIHFPALSPLINSITINIDLKVRDPFSSRVENRYFPSEWELDELLEDNPKSFASQLFDYAAILLKSLAGLLSYGDPGFNLLYIEAMTLNLRRPTCPYESRDGPNYSRRQPVAEAEAKALGQTMRETLKDNAKGFSPFAATDCFKLSPLIQIGALKFASEGQLWGEGHNMVLAGDDFRWLHYGLPLRRLSHLVNDVQTFEMRP